MRSNASMRTSDFDYKLPPELIAQTPIEARDHSRLLVIHRSEQILEDRQFFQIVEYLHRGDLLIFNDSRVIPARIFGSKSDTGGKVELLLLRLVTDETWETLAKPGKRLKLGTRIQLATPDSSASTEAEIIGVGCNGIRLVRISRDVSLDRLGTVPLPPYIHSPISDPERYQTVYARIKGSTAAPTAGLHFTSQLLIEIENTGVETAFVTVHIGLDTFRPVIEDDPRKHKLHGEYCDVPPETAEAITRARRERRRVIAVGTTAVRALETVGQMLSSDSVVPAYRGQTELFILPGHRFRLVDALITNFHLPKSSLLMLVSAFAGKDLVFRAYDHAISQAYRFYSFGDATLIL